MAGTVIVSEGNSFDIRTIDFERIAEAIRAHTNNSGVSKKILQSLDEFGMDMICADELEPTDFKIFLKLLNDIRVEFLREPGLIEFLDKLLETARADRRLFN